MQLPIPDRTAAGRWLAELLRAELSLQNPIILALPRGGVPVAFEIAQAYHAKLDLLLVRKLGMPAFPELAMGAISSGGIKVLNQSVIQAYNISEQAIQRVEEQERTELERREQVYRGDRPLLNYEDRNIILVDDGLATGSTMLAAIDAIKLHHPKSITVAVPVSPPDTITAIQNRVDNVICPFQPADFSSIGQWYVDFSQVSDAEVKQQLKEAWNND